ncbi:MAG TPA: nucleotide exchange factor GrpE [Acidimicrobiales bacterium]|nr:nucleotide exchange factor GrpE [Acidimicrobiales bacterium]
MTEPSDNPFRRHSRAAEDPLVSPDSPDSPEPSEPEDPSELVDADEANSIWSDLRAAVRPPEGDTEESRPESSDPGLPGDSLGAPPPADFPGDTGGSVSDPVAQAESVVLQDFVTLTAERDDYLLQVQRLQADFDNYRKRIIKQQGEQVERAAEGLVSKLLDVLDTFDLALAHGEGFDQVHGALMGLLEKEGLERLDPTGEPFDPNEADAVAHEEGDDGPVVADVLRAGYRWKGRVLRPAMVKVRG